MSVMACVDSLHEQISLEPEGRNGACLQDGILGMTPTDDRLYLRLSEIQGHILLGLDIYARCFVLRLVVLPSHGHDDFVFTANAVHRKSLGKKSSKLEANGSSMMKSCSTYPISSKYDQV